MNRYVCIAAIVLLSTVVTCSIVLAHDPPSSQGPHLMTPEVLKRRLEMLGFVVDGPISGQGTTYRAKGSLRGKAKELVIDRQSGAISERVAGRLQRVDFGPPTMKDNFVGSKARRAAEPPAADVVRPVPRKGLEIMVVPQ